ncbi:MAG TPA: M15 family metallopeptidase [Candidatus Blautia stercoripullorum]|uniref:M15 family metallopeptidase n=1 Tax=Candidatus Blautia stercoripullorum TaxID=2838502 RepID=A0A9D2U661_9FIRM|nr:M15 family metallopeptidase [Candidatus Blautia stercoripullorum]
MDSRRHTRYRRRYKGNIKRIRQRNRRLGIFLLAVFVAIAGVTNIVRTKHREAAAQAYAEKQAEKENQKAKEQEDSGLKLADEKEKEQWYLKLVNAKNPMTQEDVPEVATETIDSNGYQVDARIMGDLEDMFAAARAAGRNPVICSAFRAWETQEYLYQNKIQRVMSEEGLPEDQAAVEAGTVVAVPGTSEHQIGLALDIVSSEYMNLDEKQMETEDQQWLMENSWKYGFILRYPLDKSDITGIIFEPWHYRYVGKEAAKEIYEQDITLEEYLGAEPVGSSQAIESDSEDSSSE